METLRLKLKVQDYPVLNEPTRAEIRAAEWFNSLPLPEAQQAWGGTVPNQVCMTARFQNSAVFITEDWDVTIRSRRLIDSVESMCAMINAFGTLSEMPVEIELFDAHDTGSNSLYRQLRRERRKQQYRRFALWSIPILVTIFGTGISIVLCLD